MTEPTMLHVIIVRRGSLIAPSLSVAQPQNGDETSPAKAKSVKAMPMTLGAAPKVSMYSFWVGKIRPYSAPDIKYQRFMPIKNSQVEEPSFIEFDF
jgi:hypothetical protein